MSWCPSSYEVCKALLLSWLPASEESLAYFVAGIAAEAVRSEPTTPHQARSHQTTTILSQAVACLTPLRVLVHVSAGCSMCLWT